MLAIVAYADFERFRVLPYAGGPFDQPADLMDDLRYVADVVAAARKTKADAETSRLDRMLSKVKRK